MEYDPWAVEMISIVKANAPSDVNIDDMVSDGMYLQHATSAEVIAAFEAAGYTVGAIIDTGDRWIRSKIDPQCGIAIGTDDVEPDCSVWWFYDHNE